MVLCSTEWDWSSHGVVDCSTAGGVVLCSTE